jgi:hypothetical protein
MCTEKSQDEAIRVDWQARHTERYMGRWTGPSEVFSEALVTPRNAAPPVSRGRHPEGGKIVKMAVSVRPSLCVSRYVREPSLEGGFEFTY